MRSVFRIIAISGLLISFLSESDSQIKVILEDDIDFNVVKWHYIEYPNAHATWEEISINAGAKLYRAEFEFEGHPRRVIYNSQGIRMQEEANLTKNVPVSLLSYLDDIYLKYRILSFTRITDFRLEEKVTFKVEVKSKSNGVEILEFDKNLIPLDSVFVSGSN
ncbi:MAG: hypothetical protein JXR03_07670 [Cyclobacteriaceae bacterium]